MLNLHFCGNMTVVSFKNLNILSTFQKFKSLNITTENKYNEQNQKNVKPSRISNYCKKIILSLFHLRMLKNDFYLNHYLSIKFYLKYNLFV